MTDLALSLPQPLKTPILGHLPLAFDLLKLLKECHKDFGDAFAWQMGPRYVAVFSSPEANRQILLEDAARLSATDSFGPQSWILGQGLARLDGQSHKRMKKLLLPAFHREVINGHFHTIKEITTTNLRSWQRQIQLDATKACKGLALEIIIKSLFDLSLEAFPRLKTDLRKVFDALMVESGKPQTFLRFLAMLKVPGIPNLRQRLDHFFLERISEPSSPNSMLFLLKQATDSDGMQLSKQELRDQLLTLIVAGHDTTATALAWLLYELAHHPENQSKLREELKTANISEPTSLRGLPFLNAVIKETLRLHPPISLGIRKALEPLKISGFEIPKGANVLYCPYLTHRNPKLWGNPAKFLPERFLGPQPSRFSYVPFGAGEHSCIGMNLALFELQVIVVSLLTSCSWTLVEQPTEKLSPTLEPVNLHLKFSPL